MEKNENKKLNSSLLNKYWTKNVLQQTFHMILTIFAKPLHVVFSLPLEMILYILKNNLLNLNYLKSKTEINYLIRKQTDNCTGFDGFSFCFLLGFRCTASVDQMSPQSHTVYWDKKMYSLQQTLQWGQRL